ncbi:hypothetical protein [Tropicimonas marinistellae]|uniref:hypothetical protein n=1 Tax=Tropicimonas marinistellae TaxID=1739787 RepID=UPI0008320DF6|nr:hypothetical protein [Tropicimonas marinistellae]
MTQGTLFNCAKADRYKGKRVYGLAITARCDVANDKYPVLNYLPVVSLLDWMHCDGIEILLSNAQKNAHSQFLNILKQAGIASSVLDAVDRQTLVAAYFDAEDAPKALTKQSKKAHEVADLLDHLYSISTACEVDRNWLLERYSKEASSLVKDLVQNKVLSFYYLPSVTDENERDGFVVLLRESAFLPRKIAKQLAVGLPKPIGEDPDLQSQLSFAHEDFAMPIGQIPSPHIEHLIQTFSYMFGRIGLEDYTEDFVADVCGQSFCRAEEPTE